MRRGENQLKKLTQEMSLEQRMRAWLGLMREAGGLDFEQADSSVRRQIKELVRSAFDADDPFLSVVHEILVLNRVCAHFFEAHWSEAYYRIGTISALLAVSVMTKEKGVRQRMLRGLTKPRPAEHGSVPTEDSDLVAELGRYLNTALTADTSMGPYWLELLRERKRERWQRDGEAPHFPLDELLQSDTEAFLRPLLHHVRELNYYLVTPIQILDFVVSEPSPVTSLPTGECLLPPIDSYRKRNEAVLKTLINPRWGIDAPPPELAPEVCDDLRGVLASPSSLVLETVDRFWRWL